MKQTYAYLKKRCRRLPDITLRLPEILDDYFGGGYGVPTKAASNVSCLLKDKEGIALDTTYTSKAFAAVYDYCKEHGKEAGSVLYWHTCNSADLTDQANSVDYRNLPKALQGFIL
jgi:1-aminocyclopropane-1-carboxylate deaminase/D-cysteine desulfhydrase-like pyridoxal-dependent ACC family enzyme